jgi:anti-anti-sigma regulatory factor
MDIQSKRNIVCDTPSPGIRVVRFVRPDLRTQLDDQEEITDCTLYQELDAAVLANLAAGEVLVLNFGLIEWYYSAFHRLLLKVRESVQTHNARLLLCCFTPNAREGFDLFGGGKVFDVRATEANAVSGVGKQDEPAGGKPRS